MHIRVVGVEVGVVVVVVVTRVAAVVLEVKNMWALVGFALGGE